MYNELLDYVDEKDNLIWTKEKHEIYSKKLINRICHIIVLNSKWEMALQKRSSTVSFMPGAWSTSAWWHVCAGHTYKESALRELQEEIGITGELEFLDKITYINKENNHSKFLWIFELQYDWDFIYEDGEVEFVEYFSLDNIKIMINSWDIFHPELLYILKKYYFDKES